MMAGGGGGRGCGHREKMFWGRLGLGVVEVGGEMGKAMVTSENPRQSVENRPTPNVVPLSENHPPAPKTLEIASKSAGSSPKPNNMRTLLAGLTLALQGSFMQLSQMEIEYL